MYKLDDLAEQDMIIIDSIFDYYRIVEPIDNTVFRYYNGELIPTEQKCYELWGHGRKCLKCTSFKACTDKKVQIKVETNGKEVRIVHSVPILIDDKYYAIELIKDVNETMYINAETHKDQTDLLKLVYEFNELVTHNSFTGLYNKKFSEQKVIDQIKDTLKNGTTLFAAIIDVDNFKFINDTFGHKVGDEVILNIVDKIKNCISDEKDWAGRIGGDEFLMVFVDKTLDEINNKCNKLAECVKEYSFIANYIQFNVSITIGVKEFNKEEDNEENFLEHVDKIMYEIKRKKKNK